MNEIRTNEVKKKERDKKSSKKRKITERGRKREKDREGKTGLDLWVIGLSIRSIELHKHRRGG